MKEHAKEYHKEFMARKVGMDAVFEQTMRIVQELQRRIECQLTMGMQYKGADNPEMAEFDSDLAKSAEGLGKLTSTMAGIHLRLLKAGIEKAESMSLEEEVDHMIEFFSNLPPNEALRAKEALGW